MLSGFWKQMIKARSKSEYTEVTSRWPVQSFPLFTCDELRETLAPEVYLFLDHTAYTLFFRRPLPSALRLHRKTMWQAENVEVSGIQKKPVGKCSQLTQEDLFLTKSPLRALCSHWEMGSLPQSGRQSWMRFWTPLRRGSHIFCKSITGQNQWLKA